METTAGMAYNSMGEALRSANSCFDAATAKQLHITCRNVANKGGARSPT